MRHNRIQAPFASVFTAAAPLAAAPAFAQTPYDGLWQVTVVTKSGSCEPTTSSTLTVTDGKVSAGGAPVPAVSDARTCAGLDQWCICERPAQWQDWIGEVEWCICRRTVQWSMGSITAISRTNESIRDHATADIRSRRVFGGPRRHRQLRAIGAVCRFGRQLVRRRHRHPRRWFDRANPLSRHLCRRRRRQRPQSEPDLRQRQLQVQPFKQRRRPGRALPGPGAKTVAMSAATSKDAAAAATFRSSPPPPVYRQHHLDDPRQQAVRCDQIR